MKLPDELQFQLDCIRGIRGRIQSELNLRELSGRIISKEFSDFTTNELRAVRAELKWQENKINELLAPYEMETENG